MYIVLCTQCTFWVGCRGMGLYWGWSMALQVMSLSLPLPLLPPLLPSSHALLAYASEVSSPHKMSVLRNIYIYKWIKQTILKHS